MERKFIFLIGAILVIASFFVFSSPDVKGIEVIQYKSSSCGCCVGHKGYLENEGFNVRVEIPDNLDSFKDSKNIPMDMRSCHTEIIRDYFVEGHVPLEAINKMLSEKPDIDGISLPEMPSGAPGMPGKKDREWIIYSLKNGVSSEFMRI